jgi:hypothetical protein
MPEPDDDVLIYSLWPCGCVVQYITYVQRDGTWSLPVEQHEGTCSRSRANRKKDEQADGR